MFGEQFYPTPETVIKKMLEPWKKEYTRHYGFSGYQVMGYPKLEDLTILEPSAGSGSILDFIAEESRNARLYCCEIDPNLRHILQDKNYKVIADDFLEYNGDYFFDLIIMNPPFANGDEHLLKAWNILDSGDIVCLLNSETINNPYSKKRQLLLKLIEAHGSVEELGNVFSDAERETDVNVSLVRLTKENKSEKFNFHFEDQTKEKQFNFDENVINNGPALKDIVGNMIVQYDKIKEGFVEYMRLAAQLNHYGSPLVFKNEEKVEHEISIFSVAQEAYSKGRSKKDSFNIFCDRMKSHMWKIVMANINNISSFDMERFMTHNVRSNFSEFTQKQGQMDFTRENVWNLITMLHENKHTILERAVGDVFDLLTKYYSENRHYIEGWKTNSKWKVNKKIILPRAIQYGNYDTADYLKTYGAKFSLHYDCRSEYSDIDKVMDYLTGGRKEGELGLYESLEMRFDNLGKIRTGDKFDNTGESHYFKWKFFKKGTLHIEFKDTKLWEEFNIRACMQRNWLPEEEVTAYRKKKEKQSPQPERIKHLLLEEVLEEDFQL